MSTAKKLKSNGNAAHDDAAQIKSAVEGSATAMMMVDRDFKVTYINPASYELLNKHQGALRQVFPFFDVNKLMGACIDSFHKNPSHQRKLLDDVRNLPYKADIAVGPLKFALNVSAIKDANGKYIGNSLEWADVTEVRARENEVARIQSALLGSATAMMMIDRDFKITYFNPASKNLLQKHLSTLRTVWPSLDIEKLVGTCIDMFHKNPSHQRRLLDDPNNLPYKADIAIGPLKFALNVSAMKDAAGKYIGNSLEWADVTEARKKENEIARMNSMIENSATNFMVCDRDFKITYCNPAVINLVTKYQTDLRKFFPSLDVNKLIGTCIDSFHKEPSKQRRILSDVKNLPMQTDIKVGELEFGLSVSALMDASGNHIGNAVEWIDQNARATYRNEVGDLIGSLKAGEMKKRGKLDRLDKTYQPMMQGINEVVDAIVAPIAELQDRLSKVAQGDLTAYVTGEYNGDHAALKNALNNTLDSLNDILTNVDGAADQIASGSGEVSSSSQSLSQAATEQASSLEEISASMTELSGQTKQNAENATQANQLSSVTRGSAESGNRQMQDMVRAMKEIEESSQNISKIIKVIDEIAFQTNLLALNAAVEAARAGVHGKGFAVVAEEVRNLAARCAKAAKETTDLIESSVKKVELGTNIANKTAEALGEIVTSVGKVTDLVGEIAAASNEQAQGIAQVNQGLSQMDQVTQQNTASSEESAAAAEELSSQAAQLREMLQKFTLARKQPAASGAPGNIPPEMWAAFQKFMTAQSKPEKPATAHHAPAAKPTSAAPKGWGAPKNDPAKNGNTPKAKDDHKTKSESRLKPGDVIALDDKEFGRY